MAVSNEAIRDFVATVLAMDMSDADRAAMINMAAEQYGVSNSQIAAATGFSVADVNAYLAPPPPVS